MGGEATIAASVAEATTVGRVLRTAGQDRPIVGRAIAEVITAAPVQPTAGRAAAVIIVAAAGETMFAM